jgi:hypothetical protein
MRPKPHHIEIDGGDPNEMHVLVSVMAEDGETIDIIAMFPLDRREEAHAMGHRLATVFMLPLSLIDGYGAEPKLIPVKA